MERERERDGDRETGRRKERRRLERVKKACHIEKYIFSLI